MNNIKNWLLIFNSLVLFIGIQPVYPSISIDDGINYTLDVLKSRSQYLNSLVDFMSDPEIQILDKMDLIGSVTTENYERKLKEFIASLPQESRDQELQEIASEFINYTKDNPLHSYDFLIGTFYLGLEGVNSSPELLEFKNQLQAVMRDFLVPYFKLNLEELDQVAKLITGYKCLIYCIAERKREKIIRGLPPLAFSDDEFEVKDIEYEFYRTELEILESLKSYVITLMPEKDRKVAEVFHISYEKCNETNDRTITVWDDKALRENATHFYDSFRNLGSEVERLNSEFFRIHKKIIKKLSVKEISKNLRSLPELHDLSKPPTSNPTENLNYFLTSTAINLVSKFEFIDLNIKLHLGSRQKLRNLLQSIAKTKTLVKDALDAGNTIFDIDTNLFCKIYDWYEEEQVKFKEWIKQGDFSVLATQLSMAEKGTVLESYTTHIHSILYAEAAKFNMELSQKISNFTELLMSFDECGIQGNKQRFKPIKMVLSTSIPHDNSQLKIEGSTLALSSDTELESQSLPLEDQHEQNEFTAKHGAIIEDNKVAFIRQESDHNLEALESKSERTAELEDHGIESTIISSAPIRASEEQTYKIYSRKLKEGDKLSYKEQLNRDIKGRYLDLLEILYSTNPGEISFNDLNNLVKRCGGLLEFGRGSHFRITMPGRKIVFGFKPHGSGHSSKLRNLALESFRTALSDIRDAVLVR